MGTFTGTAGDDVLTGTADDDTFDLTQGGNDTVQGLAGDDIIMMGSTLTAADRIDGGDGSDTVELDGDYSKGLVFAATTMTNVEKLSLATGHSYKLVFNDANVAAGAVLTIDGSHLGVVAVLTVDGSAETDGSFYISGGAGKDILTGGAGNDTFWSGAGNDVVHGGAGDDFINVSDSSVAFGGDGDDAISGKSYAGSHLTLSGDAGDDDLGVDTEADANQMAVLSGGDGQDYFIFSGNGRATADGGADTDVFYLQQTGNGVTLTLGEGMDVVLPDPRYVGQQVTEITDFTTGDGGDVVYLKDYLQALFPGWTPEQDPFALGYVQVVQSGANAILQVKSGDSWQPVLAFDNTLASSLVPGDSIRWGYSLTTPILVTSQLTIASDQVITGFACPPATQDWYYGSAIATGEASGIKVINNGQILLNGLGLNLDWTGGAGGKAAGIYVNEWGATVENHGVIATIARMPLTAAEGIRTYGDVNFWNTGEINISAANAAGIDAWSGHTFTNDGRIEVHAPGEAFGLLYWEGPDILTNTGTILVTGFTPVAIEDDDASFTTLTNSGTIEADGGASVGITWIGSAACELDNSGTISAVTAIYEQAFADYADTTLRNSGLIVGLVSLNDGVSTVYNSGRIIGDVLLGPHNDVFDGRGGSVTGVIDGEGGNDIYIIGNASDVVREEAGAGNDTVKTTLPHYVLPDNIENLAYIGTGDFSGMGNALNNVVTGGAGNDTLDGGAGNDRINGGGGSDTASYASATGGVTVDLTITTGQNVGGGAGTDTLISIENVEGSKFDDVLKGTAGANAIILSDGGNDTALAGDGNDVIVMGAALTAADRIDGGAGTDRLSLDGDYSAGLTFAATTMVNVETLALAAGHSYSLTLNNANVAAGQTLSVDASALGAADALTFNGSAETDGTFAIRGGAGNDTLQAGSGADTLNLSDGGIDIAQGGAGNDTFVLGTALTASDRIDGGAGSDKVVLDGDYSAGLTFSATTMVNVETLSLTAGHSYSLTMNNANVAAGQTLTIDGSQLGASDALAFTGTGETDGKFVVLGGAGNDAMIGGSGNDTLNGGTGDDVLNLARGGNDTAIGGLGNDTIQMGATLTAGDTIDGGFGVDTLTLSGDYSAGLTFAATTMRGIDVLLLGTGHSYKLTLDDANVAAGGVFHVAGYALGSGDTLTFDGSHESDGHFSVVAGAGNDVIATGAVNDTIDLSHGGNDTVAAGAGNDSIVMGGALTAADRIDGGAGTDRVVLNGDYSAGLTFASTTMANVETLQLVGAHSYVLTMSDATVAAGATLTVTALTLPKANTLVFDGSAERDGTFIVTGGHGDDVLTGGALGDTLNGGAGNDVLRGGLGADLLSGSSGHNSFVYDGVTESTGPGFDTIGKFNVTTDTIDVWFQVTALDHAVSGGALTHGSFDADLAAALGSAQLGANHAVLFTPNAGDYVGETFLVVDANGIAGYQAAQDLVIELDHASHLDHFRLANFAGH